MTTETTPWLSQWTSTTFNFHCSPHTAQARTTGNNSFNVILPSLSTNCPQSYISPRPLILQPVTCLTNQRSTAKMARCIRPYNNLGYTAFIPLDHCHPIPLLNFLSGSLTTMSIEFKSNQKLQGCRGAIFFLQCYWKPKSLQHLQKFCHGCRALRRAWTSYHLIIVKIVDSKPYSFLLHYPFYNICHSSEDLRG